MKCEKCQQNTANHFIKMNINGQIQEINLCSTCAGQIGFDMAEDMDAFSTFMTHFFDSPRLQSVCPTCNRTFQKVKETGRLGCSACYDHFAPQLESYVTRLRGKHHYAGKIPASTGDQLKRKRHIETLTARLQEAVATQNYEAAVLLRDEIKTLEGGQGA